MLINITINETLTICDSVKKIIYAAITYDFAANIVTVINITINKTFRIHDLFKNYSCYWKNMNTFNVWTFIQVGTDKNNFTHVRNIDTFSVLTFTQAFTGNNKFYAVKKWTRVRISSDLCEFVI